MKYKNPLRALLWLIMIPVQLLIAILLVILGAYIDGNVLFVHTPETHGHGFPVFSMLLFFFAAFVTVIVIIVSIVITIVRLVVLTNRNKKLYNYLQQQSENQLKNNSSI